MRIEAGGVGGQVWAGRRWQLTLTRVYIELLLVNPDPYSILSNSSTVRPASATTQPAGGTERSTIRAETLKALSYITSQVLR